MPCIFLPSKKSNMPQMQIALFVYHFFSMGSSPPLITNMFFDLIIDCRGNPSGHIRITVPINHGIQRKSVIGYVQKLIPCIFSVLDRENIFINILAVQCVRQRFLYVIFQIMQILPDYLNMIYRLRCSLGVISVSLIHDFIQFKAIQLSHLFFEHRFPQL